MARPNWEWIRIDVQIAEHPKVEGLSDKAFRALIELWCYCGRQRSDGIVTEKRWRNVRVPVRKELVDNGLADPIGDGLGVVMHDYTDHQRSREQIDELSAKRQEAARKGAAARWGGHAKPHALRICAVHLRCACQNASNTHMRPDARGRGRGRGRYVALRAYGRKPPNGALIAHRNLR